jgi:hypothetical protein
MTCVKRYWDASTEREQSRCAYFGIPSRERDCDVTGTDDDLCVCSTDTSSQALGRRSKSISDAAGPKDTLTVAVVAGAVAVVAAALVVYRRQHTAAVSEEAIPDLQWDDVLVE